MLIETQLPRLHKLIKWKQSNSSAGMPTQGDSQGTVVWQEVRSPRRFSGFFV